MIEENSLRKYFQINMLRPSFLIKKKKYRVQYDLMIHCSNCGKTFQVSHSFNPIRANQDYESLSKSL